MNLEEVATVESVNGKGVRDQLTCYYGNFMMIERSMRYAIRFFGGQVASEYRNSLKAEVMAPGILHVNGREDWCKCGVNIMRCRGGKVQGSCWGWFWGHGRVHTMCSVSGYIFREHSSSGRWIQLAKVDSLVEVLSSELVKAKTGAKAQKIVRCYH